jgi:hypothetical protein
VIGVVSVWVESRVMASDGGFTLRTVCMRRRAGPLVAGDLFCSGVRTRRGTCAGEESMVETWIVE